MPQVEGIEVPIYVGRAEKKRCIGRREQRLEHYHNIRGQAIATLGGRCKCGENSPSKLHIVALSDESKGWSQLLLYKRLVDAYKYSMDVTSIAELICHKCRYEGMNKEAMARREIAKGTGIYYWVAGVRVEQMRVRKAFNVEFGTAFIYAQYEDLGIEHLEAENDRSQNQA